MLDLAGVTSDLRFSSSAMVTTLVHYAFGALVLQQAILRQTLPSSNEEGVDGAGFSTHSSACSRR
jgi:hypothetical protein